MECNHKDLVLPISAADNQSKCVFMVYCNYCKMMCGNMTWQYKIGDRKPEMVFSPPIKQDQTVRLR